MNKTSLYGEGTYLSTDLTVSMDYMKTSTGWDKSTFGNSLGCIAVCEFLKHPDVRTAGMECDNPETTSLSGRVKVPEKYVSFIICNRFAFFLN